MRKVWVLLTLFCQFAISEENLISTGMPDLGVEIKKVSMETFNGYKIVVSLDDEDASRLKEVQITYNDTKMYLDKKIQKNICSVDLLNIELFNITHVKNNKAYRGNDFYISIPFGDNYKDCKYPKNWDEKTMSEFLLTIYVVNNKISKTEIRQIN